MRVCREHKNNDDGYHQEVFPDHFTVPVLRAIYCSWNFFRSINDFFKVVRSTLPLWCFRHRMIVIYRRSWGCQPTKFNYISDGYNSLKSLGPVLKIFI